MIVIIRPVLVVVLLSLPTAALGALGMSGEAMNEVRLAYIDPGSGSFMIQALIATLAGVGVTGRLYWAKIKSMLGMASRSDAEDLDPDDE